MHHPYRPPVSIWSSASRLPRPGPTRPYARPSASRSCGVRAMAGAATTQIPLWAPSRSETGPCVVPRSVVGRQQAAPRARPLAALKSVEVRHPSPPGPHNDVAEVLDQQVRTAQCSCTEFRTSPLANQERPSRRWRMHRICSMSTERLFPRVPAARRPCASVNPGGRRDAGRPTRGSLLDPRDQGRPGRLAASGTPGGCPPRKAARAGMHTHPRQPLRGGRSRTRAPWRARDARLRRRTMQGRRRQRAHAELVLPPQGQGAAPFRVAGGLSGRPGMRPPHHPRSRGTRRRYAPLCAHEYRAEVVTVDAHESQ